MGISKPLPKLVAIHGKKRSGKGTTAEYLMREHGYKIVKFADPLKDMLRVLLRYCGFDEETIERAIEGDLKEAPWDILGGKSVRFCMQKLGTEWRRMVDDPLWVNIAMSRVRAFWDAGEKVVIDDLRFPTEHAVLVPEDAFLLKVKNSRLDDGGDTGQHESENELPDEWFDKILHNDDTFDALYGQIEDGLSEYGLRLAA